MFIPQSKALSIVKQIKKITDTVPKCINLYDGVKSFEFTKHIEFHKESRRLEIKKWKNQKR